jgi:phenylacetic acid degradation operon negative regulatory protein
LDRQCVHFHGAATDIPPEIVRSLFNLDDWAADARRLTLAMRDELDTDEVATDETIATFTYLFALSVTVVRHLQLDPLLPAQLVPQEWPGHALRSTYRRFDEVFKNRLNNGFR